MISLKKFSWVVILLFCLTCTFQYGLHAQNQSMLLPFSGDTYPTATGSKMINFTNSSNPVVTTLPKHPFDYGIDPGNPHDEDQLRAATIPNPYNPGVVPYYYRMNKEYLGQHPMFAQQVVHDKDGNLLFFIVDNNIYNKYGKAFKIDPSQSDETAMYYYLHGDEQIAPNYNRFGFSEPGASLDPEIVVFPIYKEELGAAPACYKYGIIYTTFTRTAATSVGICYRTLQYVNDQEIVLSAPIVLNQFFKDAITEFVGWPSGGWCDDESHRNLAIVETGNNEYMLFVRLWDKLCAVKIFDDGQIDYGNIHVEKILPEGMSVLINWQAASEMEAVLYNDYFYVGMGSCYKNPNSQENESWAHVCVMKFNRNLIRESGYPNNHWMPEGTRSPEHIKGLEFSADCSTLFITYTGQANLYAINTSGTTGKIQMNPNLAASLYEYSEIETGADGNLYYLYADINGNGGISQYNPYTYQWIDNLQGVNKVYFSHDYDPVGEPDAKILLFQDQRDHGDYSLYFNNMSQSCCIDHIYYSKWPDETKFSETNTWTPESCPFPNVNGIVWIDEDAVIPAGKEVSIQNLKIKFNANKKLIVEQGAKLILDNTILTSVDECQQSMFWGGIEVWGNSSQHQSTIDGNCYQGTVILENGSIIENALNAIKAIKTNVDGTSDWSKTGGIIKADGAIFRNNKNGVWLGSYHNFNPNNTILPNLSGFYNCIFEITDAYNTNMGMPHEFIGLYDVEWVKIYGNTFRNLNTSMSGSDRGNGIVSYDASYIAKEFCSTSNFPCPLNEQIPNTFTNLNCAISSSNNGTAKSVIINNNVFTDNNYSIILKSIKNAKIINNEFNVGKRLGLSLLNCNAYQVEENSFSSDDITLNYGLNIMKSGIQPNLIYRNKFYDGLSVACHAQGINNGPLAVSHAYQGYMGSGLVFKCNTYEGTNQFADIEITSGGIAGNQGTCGTDYSPAGNTFNIPSGLSTQPKNIAVNPGVAPFSYYRFSDDNADPGVLQPYPPIVTVYNCGSPMQTYSCPESNSNLDPHQLISDIGLFTTRLAPKVATIIKGNNQRLLTTVITANTAGGISFTALRDTLLNVSPYLSDTVLIAAIEKYDTLEPLILKDVMIANSPLTYKVKTVLDTKALPAQIIQAIDSVQSGMSARAELEVQISDTMMLMGLAENNLVRQYMNDTTISGVDSVISYFLTRTDDISRKNLLQAYFTKGDSTNLISALDSLRLRTYEDTLFKEFYTLMADFCTNKKSLFEIDSMQELTIRNIAATNTEAAVHAQAVIEMVFNEIQPIELEKLNIPDSLSIHGYLRSDSLCNRLPAPGDTLMLLDADTNKVAGILTVTDSAGYFVFYLPELLKLSDTAVYGFCDKDGTPIKNFELKTIEQWIAASPLNLTLRKTEANFIYDTVLCFADSVHFTSIVTGGMKPFTYHWDFDNDSVSSSKNPAIFYDTTGTYLVTLFVSSSDGCTDTLSRSITVNPSPIAVISPASLTICAWDSTTLTASGGATYLWSTVDTMAAITIAPHSSSTYTVTVTNAAGCKDTASRAVTVNPLPTVNITVSNSAICAGDSSTLTANGGVMLLWNTSDTTAAITVFPDTTTLYAVTATSAAGCSYTAREIITVNPLPIITLTPVISSICVGDSATLTVSGGLTYLWNTSDTTTTIAVVPDSTTTYTVTVTSAEGCIDSANRTVTVNILPTASITPATSSICAGDSATLTASGGATYLWNTTDTIAAITVVPDSSSTYTVTVTSAEGCNTSDTVTVTIDCASITGRTMYAGKAYAGTAPNAPTYDSRIYDINKEIVILKNQSGTEIARDTSDANGAFYFTDVDNGTYTLFYDKYTADTMQWCNDVSAADLSMILYLIASDTTTDPSRNFSRIYKKAANVDNNSAINTIDKARIQAKIGAPSDPAKNFPKGNWVNLDTTITVNGSNLNFTIPVICYGDYNASSSKYRDSANTWSQVKSLTDENIITISDESLILNNTGLIEIPLRISSSLNDFAAMGLELYYPKEKFKLVSASMPNTSDSNGVFKINPTLQEIIDNNNDLLVTDDSGIIRVVFATTSFFDVTNNDIMINLGFQPLDELEPGEIDFKLFGTGMIADQYGTEAKANEYLLIPKIFVQGNNSEAGFDFTGYPNPFNNGTTLTYNLPENGTVKLSVYNALGVCVSELVNETQLSGKHTFVFSAKNQPAGMYTFRLDFTGEKDSNCAVLKMIYYK